MRKIMLVDDEILVRIGIKSIVNWEEHGYSIVAEAASGEEALKKIRYKQPDIVMTDLVMAPIDGFELITTLKREFPSIQIIVLSCHNDFHHTKEAMRLGAKNFIFKLTIQPNELVQTLDSLENEVERESIANRSIEADKIIHSNLDAIKGKLISSAIDKSFINATQWLDELRMLKVKIDFQRQYILVYISADEFDLPNENSRIKERELLKFSMINLITEAFERYERVEVFNYKGGDVLVVINIDKEQQRSIIVQVEKTFSTLHEYTHRYLGIGISAGLSGVHSGLHSFRLAFQQANNAMKKRFFIGSGKLIVYNKGLDEETESETEWPPLLDTIKLEGYLEILAENEVKVFLTTYFDYLVSCQHITHHRIRNRLLDLLIPFIVVARKRAVQLDDMLYEGKFNPHQVIAKYESLIKIRIWFNQFASDFITRCRKQNQMRSLDEIVKVKEFVEINLASGEVNVTRAAAHVNMSESYFSHLFKKEVGSSFVDYVNSVKIERAKKMLLETNMKVYEIADRIGMENTNYFSLLFKKITGVSPTDYRK